MKRIIPRLAVTTAVSLTALCALADSVSANPSLAAGTTVQVQALSGIARLDHLSQLVPEPMVLQVKNRAELGALVPATTDHCQFLAEVFTGVDNVRITVRPRTLVCADAQNQEVFQAPVRGYLVGGDGLQGFPASPVTGQPQGPAVKLEAGLTGHVVLMGTVRAPR